MTGWRKKQIKEYEEMAIDNSTGKDKEFYDLGKKMFDRIQPITRGVPQIPQERYSKRTWVGLTDEDMADITSLPIGTCAMMLKVEAKLKEKNK